MADPNASPAFLRGISTRQVGRVIGVITGEVVSAQTVSKISRSLDGMVKAFHQARLSDDSVTTGCTCFWTE